MTCVTGRVSEVQRSQWLDSLRVRPLGALDSGEDLGIRSRSWKDDSQSWQHSWPMQRSLVVSTETPDTGNIEGAIQWRRMNRGSQTRISNVRRRESI